MRVRVRVRVRESGASGQREGDYGRRIFFRACFRHLPWTAGLACTHGTAWDGDMQGSVAEADDAILGHAAAGPEKGHLTIYGMVWDGL